MALKENDKSSEKSVSGCSEQSAPPNSQMRYRSRPTDEPADDSRVTVKSTPLTGAYNASNYAPNNAANVVSKETFCLLEDSFTPSTKELNDRLMKFLLPPKWMEYQAMAGDMAVPSGLEDSSESESTTTGIEHAGTIHVLIGHENISPGSEQMKVSTLLMYVCI